MSKFHSEIKFSKNVTALSVYFHMKVPWTIVQGELNQLVLTSPKIKFEKNEYTISLSHSNSNNSPFDFTFTCHSKIDNPFNVIANITVIHPKGPAYSSVIAIPAQFSKLINEVIIQTNMYLNLLIECNFFSKSCLTFEIEICNPPIFNKFVKPIEQLYNTEELCFKIKDVDEQLSDNEIEWIYSSCYSIFAAESNIIHTSTPLIAMHKLKSIENFEDAFSKFGNPKHVKYIVITDFSDIRTFYYALVLKLMYPANFLLLRQKSMITCETPFSGKKINALINQIPVAVVADEALFIISGGICPSQNFIEQIKENDTHYLASINQSMNSYPSPDVDWFVEKSGIAFGKSALDAFLDKYKYDMVVCTGKASTFWPFGMEGKLVVIREGYAMFVDTTHEYCIEFA